MAAIPVRPFATLVATFAAGVQGRAAALVDFSIGSVLRAVAEATADLTLWLQSIVVYVLTLTRAATSKGPDLDTWYADWGFTRLPPRAATGLVLVTRFSPTGQAVVPVGAQMSTGDGSLIFEVYADPSLPGWRADLAGYALGDGKATAVVPVQAVMDATATNASAWNVAAGRIDTARTTMPGIDTVSNPAPLTSGVDGESDAAFRARFPDFIAGLAKATDAAIGSAIEDLQLGLRFSIVEAPGLVTVAIDDGSGATPAAVVARAARAVTAVRAGGVQTYVKAASPVLASLSMTITVDPVYDPSAVAGIVGDALGAFVNGLGLAAPLPYTRLAQVAYDASAGVTNVSSVRLNGGTADMAAAFDQTIKAGAILVAPTR